MTCNPDKSCKTCSDGTFLTSGYCDACDNTTCATCNTNDSTCDLACGTTCTTCDVDSKCLTCEDGKYVDSDGVC